MHTGLKTVKNIEVCPSRSGGFIERSDKGFFLGSGDPKKQVGRFENQSPYLE